MMDAYFDTTGKCALSVLPRARSASTRWKAGSTSLGICEGIDLLHSAVCRFACHPRLPRHPRYRDTDTTARDGRVEAPGPKPSHRLQLPAGREPRRHGCGAGDVPVPHGSAVAVDHPPGQPAGSPRTTRCGGAARSVCPRHGRAGRLLGGPARSLASGRLRGSPATTCNPS